MARLAGSASLVLVDGATPLRPEPALFDAMVSGWCRQHSARRLSPTITRQRVRVVERFRAFPAPGRGSGPPPRPTRGPRRATGRIRRCAITKARWRFSSLTSATLATAGPKNA